MTPELYGEAAAAIVESLSTELGIDRAGALALCIAAGESPFRKAVQAHISATRARIEVERTAHEHDAQRRRQVDEALQARGAIRNYRTLLRRLEWRYARHEDPAAAARASDEGQALLAKIADALAKIADAQQRAA